MDATIRCWLCRIDRDSNLTMVLDVALELQLVLYVVYAIDVYCFWQLL